MLVAWSGVVILVAWAIVTERVEQRETDEFFLSSPPEATGSRAPVTTPIDPTKRLLPTAGSEFGPKALRPELAAAPKTSQPSPVKPSAASVPPLSAKRADELVGCEPGVAGEALPANATVWRFDDSEPLAPLEIQVRGAAQHLVKLERGDRIAAMMLLRAGSTAELLVPLGDFVLKYASGSGEYWCGVNARFPFGRQTSFFKADKVLAFRSEADHYSGYKIELFLQEGGNLGTSRMVAKDW